MIVNFGRTSGDYATHRRGFPADFFEALGCHVDWHKAGRLLDLGAGTGALSLRFASDGARVTALDTAPEQLAQLRSKARDLGLEVQVLCASAEDSGLAAGSFDWISAGQCWHWLDAPRATREILRLLAPNGRFLIASFDWLPLTGNVVEATEALILEHNPRWTLGGADGRHPEWRRDLECAGLQIVEEHDGLQEAIYSHEAWRGRIRASAGVAASLNSEATRRFDEDLCRLLEQRFASEPLRVPHRWSFCIAREG